MSKLCQWKSHLRKNKNTNELQNPFVGSMQIRQTMQVLHKMICSNWNAASAFL